MEESAFPTHPSEYQNHQGDSVREDGETGMTLRDYFAAKAMQAILTRSWHDGIAKEAYAMADLMLVERDL